MSGLFQYDGPVMQFLSKIFDLILLNILWILCCIPVITAGASTTAMCFVLMKLVRGDDYSVVKQFFKSFKQNFRQATVIWLIFLVALAILGVDLFLCYLLLDGFSLRSLAFVGFGFLAATVLGMLLYAFPLQACFENTIKNTLKNSFLFAVGNLFKTMIMLVADVIVVGATLLSMQAMTLFAGILAALVNVWFLKRIFAKYLEPVQAEELEKAK